MGLGTGRRGMKSPPLLIAVLLACVFVLGINYWITSSRCVELQKQVSDLEGRMRRAAAERGAVEMKKNEYEDMLAKQKEQIDNIQSLHSSQIKKIHSVYNSEKESLLNNMTAQIGHLQKRLEECRLELKDLHESQAKKLSYELAQCHNKLLEVKEQCDERLRKAALKDLNLVNEDMDKSIIKVEKSKPITKPEVNQEVNEIDDVISRSSITPEPYLLPKNKKGVISLSANEEKVKHLDTVEKNPSPIPKQLADKEDDEQGPINEVHPNLANVAEDDDEPKVEDAVDKDTNKENEDEVERENLINLEGQQEDDKDLKVDAQEEDADNANDYNNGDDPNVAEPEAEKQAQLMDNEQNLKEEKVQIALEAEDSEDPPVK